MKKWIILLGLAVALTALLLAGCQNREANNGGAGVSGSDGVSGSAVSNAPTSKKNDTGSTSGNNSFSDGLGDAGSDLGSAAKDTADDLGDAAKDIVSGAGNAVGDVVDGAGNAVGGAGDTSGDAVRGAGDGVLGGDDGNRTATEKATLEELTVED